MTLTAIRNYAEPAVLRDGTSLLIRAVRPADRPLVRDFFVRLSRDSLRRRFFGSKSELTESELAYFTEIDFDDHVALLAVLHEEGAERAIGVGRYVRAGGARAELALTVSDEHQGRGVGTLLLEHLARIARDAGVEELEADVLAENAQMMDVFKQSGFSVRQSMEAGLFHVAFPTSATEAFVHASIARERRAAAESARVFFEPSSVAVVGASRRVESLGRAILANLHRSGFRGPIYPIHPEATELEGLRCFPSLAEVPGNVDLVVIAVPAPAVESIVEQCARKGVRGVVVISAGFAEASAEGRLVQDRLRTIVRSSGMRMVGPNCMGVLNADPAICLNATFAPTWPPAGNVSILSQSGALGLAMLDHAAVLNIGIAGFVSVGNKADVSGNDLLSYWADDPRTGIIALYLESFGNPRKFARIAPEVARRKPIVAVKSGRSAAGTRAAASHSAALASLDVGIDALFEQAGIIRTNTLEEMFDVVALLSTQPVPAGPRVGVVTNAGGPGILLADACEAHGLVLPELSEDTLVELRRFLPAAAGLANPVDMIASATPEAYGRAIEVVGNDAHIDALVVIYIPPLVTHPDEVAAAIARAAGKVPANKPVATVFMSSKGTPPILSTGPRGRLPSYSFPENAALALSAAHRYGRWRERPAGRLAVLEQDRIKGIRRIIEQLRIGASEPFWLPQKPLSEILELADILVAPLVEVAPDREAAALVADTLGYPLVAKAVAPGVIHKSDIGGVILGLASADAVRSAVDTLAEKLRAAGHDLSAVLLQRQIESGVETLVGVTNDANLGPLLVVGIGGVQVELLRDVAFRLTPVSDLDAEAMVGELRGAKLLDGYRGSPPGDRAALTVLIQRVSALVDVIPELLEFEMNPVQVLRPGRGAVAVDARMRIAP